MLRDLLNLTAAGDGILGMHLVGALASELSTGFANPGLLDNDVAAGDPAGTLYRWERLTGPTAGTMDADEFGAFTFTPPANYTGTATGTSRIYKNGAAAYDETYSFTNGAATTLVYADLAASYAVRTLVGADLAATYSIAQLVGADLVASYNIGGASSLVSADLAATYSIMALVSADLSAAYAIGALVGANLQGTYAVQSNTTFARAPAGDGYRPQVVVYSLRPANTQRNNR